MLDGQFLTAFRPETARKLAPRHALPCGTRRAHSAKSCRRPDASSSCAAGTKSYSRGFGNGSPATLRQWSATIAARGPVAVRGSRRCRSGAEASGDFPTKPISSWPPADTSSSGSSSVARWPDEHSPPPLPRGREPGLEIRPIQECCTRGVRGGKARDAKAQRHLRRDLRPDALDDRIHLVEVRADQQDARSA